MTRQEITGPLQPTWRVWRRTTVSGRTRVYLGHCGWYHWRLRLTLRILNWVVWIDSLHTSVALQTGAGLGLHVKPPFDPLSCATTFQILSILHMHSLWLHSLSNRAFLSWQIWLCPVHHKYHAAPCYYLSSIQLYLLQHLKWVSVG